MLVHRRLRVCTKRACVCLRACRLQSLVSKVRGRSVTFLPSQAISGGSTDDIAGAAAAAPKSTKGARQAAGPAVTLPFSDSLDCAYVLGCDIDVSERWLHVPCVHSIHLVLCPAGLREVGT